MQLIEENKVIKVISIELTVVDNELQKFIDSTEEILTDNKLNNNLERMLARLEKSAEDSNNDQLP